MSTRCKAGVAVTLLLTLITACGKAGPSATPFSPTATLVPPTPSPTRSPVSPTDTTGPDVPSPDALTGAYLGQNPPGKSAVRFAPDSLLPDGSWWWISPPKFSPDGREMVFTKYILGDPDTKRLYAMQKMANDEWSSPEEVPFGTETESDDCHAAFSMDGSKLFFLSHRPGGPFFVVTKDAERWSEPVPVHIPNLSGVGNQFSVTRDETIYFEMSNGVADDLYRSRLVNGEYGAPENLGAVINTDDFEEYAPFIDPDEGYLIFASNRPGGFGGNDLYISFQNPDGSWTEPRNMGETINSDVGNTIPYVSPDGEYFFFITYKEGDLGYNPYWIDAQIIEDLRPPTPVSDQGHGVIAFTSERDGYEDIYVMAVPEGTDADESGGRNITNQPTSDDTDPQWSPDGSQIAFSSTRNGRGDIYIMNADGSNVRRLTHHSAVDADPTWSPDGTRIAFVSLRDGNVEIYVVDAAGNNLQRLTQNDYNDFEIDWSPDGKHIAVSSERGVHGNIYLIDVQAALQDPTGSGRQQLTDTDAHDAFPAWSPDGSRIAFISDREGRGNWEIYVMDAAGGNQERLTYTDAIEGPPSWSPDGTQIVFESDRDGDFEIYVMAADGTDVRPLTENSVQDRNPDWRPSKTPSAAAGHSCECASLDPLQTQLVYDVGPGQDAATWSFATPEEEGMDGDVLEAGVAALAEFSNLYSVLILRNDRIVLERYFRNEAPQHARNIQSASKSFLSALFGIAIHEGYIQSVDQTAAEFLPTYFASVQDPRKRDITLRHLLTMTPGFSYEDNLYGLQGDWLAAAIAYPLVSEPGSTFRYSTISSHILSAVLTEATGMSTCEFACHYLFQPLGITIDNWSRNPQGYYMGGVAMYFTPRELARFGLLYLHEGVWDGHPVVPAEWIAESMTRHVTETGIPGVSYGYFWWLESAGGHEVHAAVGHGGQTIRIVPDLNLVVVTTADSYAPAQGIEAFPLLKDYVIAAIQDEGS